MTPAQIANKHIDAWIADCTDSPTLRQRVEDAVWEGIVQAHANWQAGNATLRHERDVAQAQLAALKAACNFDVSGDASPETTVRRLVAQFQDMTQARDDAVEAAKLIALSLPNNRDEPRSPEQPLSPER